MENQCSTSKHFLAGLETQRRARRPTHIRNQTIFSLNTVGRPSVGGPLLGNCQHDDHRDEVHDGLAKELRDLRAKYAELKEKYENILNNFGNKFKEQINEYREKMNEQVQKADREAATTVEREKAEAAERIQAAENSVERIKAEATAAVNIAQAAEQEAKHRLETAERSAAELRTELQAARDNCNQMRMTLEAELQQLQTQLETVRAQVTEPEAAVQETEIPAEEAATRPKSLCPTSSESENSSSSSSDDFPLDAANASRADRTAACHRKRVISPRSTDENDGVPLACRRRIQPSPSPHSAPTQVLSDSQSSDEGAIPRNQLAQAPPPSPAPIRFTTSELLPGLVANGNAGVTVNYPTPTSRDFPPILPPGLHFNQWQIAQGLNINPRTENVLRRDLELRRRFLMEGNLTQEERQFVIAHIPPAYAFSPKYLRALAGLALHSFDVIDPIRRRELVFALLFCFSRWCESTLNKFLNQF